MDLNTLAINLRTQAEANSTIVLDQSVLPNSTLASIQMAFALDAGTNLTVTGVKASDIPDPTSGGKLTIKGTTSVLKQTKVPVGLTFTASDGALQAVIVTEMPEKWTFKDSFDGLDRFPFNKLETSGAHFVYTTVDQSDFAWPGDQPTPIQLERGLNFLSQVTFKHFTALQKLLKLVGGDLSVLVLKWWGRFGPLAGQDLPVGKLRVQLTSDSFAVGEDPFQLSLAAPAIAVRIGEATDDSAQAVDLLVEAEFQRRLKVTIAIPPAGGVAEISTEPLENDPSINALIGSLPGGPTFTHFMANLPSGLSGVFTNVRLNKLGMLVSSKPEVTYAGLSVGTTNPWQIVPGLLLEDLSLEIQTFEPAGLNLTSVQIAAGARFLSEIFTDKFDFVVELQRLTTWQVERISGSYHGSVNLGTIVGKIGNESWVPSALRGIEFSDFGVTVNRAQAGLTYSFYGSAEASFPIFDHQLTSALSLIVNKTPTATEIALAGGIVIGEQVFSFSLKLAESGSVLKASWENKGKPLGFADIAAAFGWTMPEVPQGLDLSLKSVQFTYDFETVVLTAHSANGLVRFASLKRSSDKTRVYLFSLDIPLNVKFTELPLVGESLRTDPPVGIDDLEIDIASAALSEGDITALNELLAEKPDDKTLIPKLLAKGITIAAKIEMSGPHEVVLPLTGGDEREAGKLLMSGAASESTALVASTSGNGHQAEPKWFPLKKTLGPVHFDKVGVQYQNAKLTFLLNAAFTAAGLTLSVDGLSVGSSLKKFEPDFDLRGLGIEYKAGDVEIGGAFLKTGPKGSESYDGAAVIKTKQFALSALGSYAKIQNEPSLFIYAFLDYPLGGPAFFFVTGLAAGFGYNRRLIAPSIDNVAEFPLIKQAVRGRDVAPKGVMDALNSLRTHVPPSSGSIFLAVGVKFNSFKLIDSFALLTMEFGDKLAINLLGLSTATVPTPEAGKTVTPLAQVQIAWKATFDPDDGCLAIDARLTPNSYILSKDCRLSGGYAFYSWFSGRHAGDFVQTLGGYHPEFKVPAHYPRVPRLAFDWRVSSALTIQGDAYYALTGSALMAGGHLEVLYRQGNLRAWLKVGADFLIAWKPYHYDARLYVNVGASYTFDINLLFTRVRVTISVDVGAQLHLWGPDFSGTARIDLSVISFTISFGAGASQKPEPIKEWSTFQQSFLPAKNVCSIAVKDGLVRNIGSGESERWVINPKELALVVDSAVPFKSAKLKSKPTEEMVQGAVQFGVGPMDVASAKVNSNVIVTVMRGEESVEGKFKYSVIKKKVPAGLWGESASPKVNGNNFLDGIPAAIEILPNTPPDAGKTANVDVKVLDHGDTDFPRPCAWGPVSLAPPGDKGKAGEKRKKISDTISSNSMRAQIMKELNVKIDVNVKQTIAGHFVSAPQIGPFYVK